MNKTLKSERHTCHIEKNVTKKKKKKKIVSDGIDGRSSGSNISINKFARTELRNL